MAEEHQVSRAAYRQPFGNALYNCKNKSICHFQYLNPFVSRKAIRGDYLNLYIISSPTAEELPLSVSREPLGPAEYNDIIFSEALNARP